MSASEPRPELDAALVQLFAAARRPTGDAEFTQAVLERVASARRMRSAKAVAQVVLLLVAAAAAAPFVADLSLTVVRHLDVWLPSFGNALASPVGWACSLAIGAWSLRRARVIRGSR